METTRISKPSEHRISKKPRKSVACQRCHSHKIKCDGQKPCKNCKIADNVVCEYPIKDRKTTVRESYINDLLKEIERLKQHASTPQSDNQQQSPSDTPEPSVTTNSGNPLVRDDAWFVPLDESPIFIGEAACTAFSSRLRQLLLHTQAEIHMARTHYIQDAQILQAAEENAAWPRRPQAYLLVESVIATVGQCYHLSSLSGIRSILDKAYIDRSSLSQMQECKLFSLFALAQVYSPRLAEAQDMGFPGLAYFAKARKLLPVVPERATADHVEILICFTLYSLSMNRRHSAYWYIGSAMRLSMTLGLHNNIAKSQLPDLAARQMRARLWWTVYSLDRFIASKIGHSAFILNDDIEVSPPSDSGLTDAQKGDVVSADYLCASMRLASIAGETISTLYSRKKNDRPFVQKVQAIFKSLRDWSATLPESVKMWPDKPASWHIVALHLSFNQCVILATRPTLLQVFHVTNRTNRKDEIPQATFMLAETCVHTARHTCRLLTQAWTALPALDYSSAQYLFAAATILAVSNLCLGSSVQADKETFQSAHHLMQQLDRLGNIAAREFCQHLDAVLECISRFEAEKSEHLLGVTPQQLSNMDVLRMDEMTSEMAIFQPNLQDFLSYDNADLEALFPFDTTDLWPYVSMPDFEA
ncbi:putative fungal-specific transcription factor [Aureobasidium sp. EXF-8845]|nr:putative fungal-specific transcription factor [Aureobasidium sp. EXF-8845]KAI4834492.1 putative fungal-specific transcription factor [Aureobasidium sp. EXF-8846]